MCVGHLLSIDLGVRQPQSRQPPTTDGGVKLEKDSTRSSVFPSSMSVLQPRDNIFLRDDLMGLDDDADIVGDLFGHKDDLSVDLSSGTAADCSSSYFELFQQSSQASGGQGMHHSSLFGSSGGEGVLDAHHYDRMVKKQERMIKNRQAASLSRQRKKEVCYCRWLRR